MPLCSPILLPTSHALALHDLQWRCEACMVQYMQDHHRYEARIAPSTRDLRSYMIDSPPVDESVVPELLLTVVCEVCFCTATFGESIEALILITLPHALDHLMNKLVKKSPQKPQFLNQFELDDTAMLSRITSKGKQRYETGKTDVLSNGLLKLMAFEQGELWGTANERITWHEKLDNEEAIQNRVHEPVSVGNLEAAVSLLLSTHPESTYFYANALRAVALSSAVSRSLLDLAIKVVAANMVRTDSHCRAHIFSVCWGYQEACSHRKMLDVDDVATLAATHLKDLIMQGCCRDSCSLV
ncbi:hypothetical protein LOK49_LG09G00159 [Camellia lanceoleosa]|uniref:Uncharacterized protein n=1 Tax=Camellia lanceoleosa TaxID=1840588 RepID=A0ACC0GFR6_9ERIC|nr:hypothetical protein LOK49_LG09G00159 [Camellia lanceoleosa]